MQAELLSISNVCGGAVEEVFQRELDLVLKNIADPNTNPEAARAITLEFKIKPFKDRSGAQVEFACKSKMAGIDTVKGTMFLQRSGNSVTAVAHDPRQARLFNPAPAPAEDEKKVQ
jgi:hypothetical protein